jgi:hypothetical protein
VARRGSFFYLTVQAPETGSKWPFNHSFVIVVRFRVWTKRSRTDDRATGHSYLLFSGAHYSVALRWRRHLQRGRRRRPVVLDRALHVPHGTAGPGPVAAHGWNGTCRRRRPSGGRAAVVRISTMYNCWANKRMVSVVGIDSSLMNGGEEVPVRFKQKKY